MASGKLKLTMGGPAVLLKRQRTGCGDLRRSGNWGRDARRSLYLEARRGYPLTFLEVFDSPSTGLKETGANSVAEFVADTDEW